MAKQVLTVPLLLALGLGLGGVAWGQTFTCLSNGTNCTAPIPDANSGEAGVVTSTIIVGGDVCSSGSPLGDLNARVKLAHAFVGDLSIDLTSPGGETVTMLDRPGLGFWGPGGCPDDDIDMTFDDTGSLPWPCQEPIPAISGTVRPAELLAAFDGLESASGAWTLTVRDHAHMGVGMLQDWGLTVACGASDLGVSVVASPSTPVHPLQPISYATTAHNAGPSAASAVILEHALPSGTLPDAVDAPGWVCMWPLGMVTCTRASLGAGESATVTVTVTPVAQGTFYSTVSIEADAFFDPNHADNTVLLATPVVVYTPATLLADPSGSSTAANHNGVAEPGEVVEVQPSWRNPGPLAMPSSGTVSSFTGPGGTPYSISLASAVYPGLPPVSTGSCPVGSCYQLVIPDAGSRPATHWDASFVETLASGESTTWTMHLGSSFSDVPSSSIMYTYVESLLHAHVTAGCGAATYCPAGTTSRAQLAMFLARSQDPAAGADVDANIPWSGTAFGQPYQCVATGQPGGASLFTDVTPNHQACRHVHHLAALGTVEAADDCSADPGIQYCPNAPYTPYLVDRGTMALFVARALAGSDAAVPSSGTAQGCAYNCATPAGTTCFSDVHPVPDPDGTASCKHIHYLYGRGVVSGYGNGTFQPASMVRRDQMAKFLANGFALKLYGQ
jgi:uncharacterized repeat protein (TIGR01451 family)